MLIFSLLFTILIQNQISIKVEDCEKNQFYIHYFELTTSGTIDFSAVAPNLDRASDLANFWILDLDKRHAIWELERNYEAEAINKYISKYTGQINLNKGKYGIFFHTYKNTTEEVDDLSGLMTFLFRKMRKSKSLEHDIQNMYVDAKIKSSEPVKSVSKDPYFEDPRIVVKSYELEDNENKSFALKLKQKIDFTLYASGEISGRSAFDYSVIKNAASNEIVWSLSGKNAKPAGGGEKNKKYQSEISLDKGEYYVEVYTDDSHSTRYWNVAPPFDPNSWGLTLKVKNLKDLDAVHIYDPYADMDSKLAIGIQRVADSKSIKKYFRVVQDAKFRLYALGEIAGSDLADVGSIVDAKSRTEVWSMSKKNTLHAGGANKNRFADIVIDLKAGDYILQYKSDDSHSYGGEFNDDPPRLSQYWGISLFYIDPVEKKIELIEANSNVIIEISRVRSNENLRKMFQIDTDQYVTVEALGEGSKREMADYGWLENENGSVIWEMEFSNSERAGGSSKNRIVTDRIFLKKGKYYCCYKTDDSHAYNDWNDDRPDNPEDWGIRVFKSE